MAEDRIVPYEHPTSSMAGQGNDDSNGSQWIGVDDLKPAGTSEPEISETSISPSDEFLKVHIQHPNLGCCPRVYVHRDHTKGRKQQLQKKLNKAMCVDRDRGI
ncbi:unnamed protein product [Brassica oleracea var. botrytis]|uniref:(rape) hypothetical protein n=1 Tax=Brassica napus TaxID=3708 RepID=A0A816IZ58_BRANA|nr:unnamed protein product [Brassica napus]